MKNLLYIANDHAGYSLKLHLLSYLQQIGNEYVDLGCDSNERVDYPDFAEILCKNVLKDKNSLGILICGSGIGMSIAANRFKGIRAALCYDPYNASLARKHNNANILCLGARTSGVGIAESVLQGFLNADFEGGRHEIRVAKLDY